jgi:CRP-like cAMP-binding protein
MHKIFSLLCNYNIISERTYEAVLQKLIISEYPEKTILISPDQPQEMVYFIAEGTTRNFYSRLGQQWTNGFDTAGDCIMTSSNFIYDQPSIDYVETCTAVTLFCISRKNFLSLILHYPDMEKVYQEIMERRLIRLEKRMQDLYMLSEEELFQKFERDYPNIHSHVEDQYIASYLRMNLATFLKVKKKVESEKRAKMVL